jgi:hypothetical protein
LAATVVEEAEKQRVPWIAGNAALGACCSVSGNDEDAGSMVVDGKLPG